MYRALIDGKNSVCRIKDVVLKGLCMKRHNRSCTCAYHSANTTSSIDHSSVPTVFLFRLRFG